MQIIGDLLIYVGIFFISIGIFGIYRFKNFYQIALTASLVDTVGYISIILGIIIKNGFSFFSLKLGFVLLITLIINPLISHAIVRSAYISGYKIGKD